MWSNIQITQEPWFRGVDWRISDCFRQSQRLLIHTSNLGTTSSKKTLHFVFDCPWEVNGLRIRPTWRDWKKEHAIYYLSKKFTEYESKYSPMEKMCCALVWLLRDSGNTCYTYHMVNFQVGSHQVYFWETILLRENCKNGKSYYRNTTFTTYLKRQSKEAALRNFLSTELKKNISQWSLNFRTKIS